MRHLFIALFGFVIVSCSSTTPQQNSPKTELTAIERSNQIAKEFTLSNADRYPEGPSSMGYHEYDRKAIQLEDDMETKDLAFYESWIQRLSKLIETEKDPEVRTDLIVLKNKLELFRENTSLMLKYQEVELHPVSKNVFVSLQELVKPQASAESRKASVERFKAYVEGHGGFKPLAVASESRTQFKMKRAQDKALYPTQQEVEQYLKDSPEYVKGVRSALEASGRTDWTEAYDKFKVQVEKYDSFVRKTLLPKARKAPRLPEEIYALALKLRDLQTTPQELIQMSTTDFKVVYQKYQDLARKLALKYKLKKNDPVSVIQHLKKQQVTKTQDVEALYQEASRTLTDLIVKNELVTLPATPLKIRMAGDAESKAVPVPHLTQPILVNNQGERPEFVVPSSSSGKLPFDDFSYKAAALILTAHEGRPGHDLQFSSMLDQGVSVIRARYAVTNVNVEGWALYAEDLVYPYLPEESQFAALQTRLWRIVRAFLDPQVQLGKANEKTVLDVFTKQLGVSEAMARLEYRRYAFEDIAQAPSYYYGYKKVAAMKKATQERLGEKFREKCFNDAFLSYGLLPLDMIAERLQTLQCGG